MPRNTKEAWSAARLEWECDPEMTLTQVAEKLNVKLGTVSERATRDGWLKLSHQAQERDMAHQVADVLGQISGRDELLDTVGASLDMSIATRVKVINRHRIELGRWRSLFPLEAMASDPVCAKRAKLAAEALGTVQRCEAQAYGLITFTGSDTGAPLVEDIPQDRPLTMLEEAMQSLAQTGTFPDWTAKRPVLELSADDPMSHHQRQPQVGGGNDE